MKVEVINMEGPLVITPQVFPDSRGYFFEPYNRDRYVKAGITDEFVQDNQSLSQKGAVRGLHLQAPPFAQGKLVRVVKGAVLDIIVDIRKNSSTYGHHYAVELTETNYRQLWVPPGFAHGFATLVDDTIFEYKCTNVYNKQSELGVLWNDPALALNWGVTNPILSDKDKELPSLADFVSPF